MKIQELLALQTDMLARLVNSTSELREAQQALLNPPPSPRVPKFHFEANPGEGIFLPQSSIK